VLLLWIYTPEPLLEVLVILNVALPRPLLGSLIIHDQYFNLLAFRKQVLEAY